MKHEMEREALSIVRRLEEVAANHKREYPASIEAVFVFSGPGTYYRRLKPGQPEWMRFMDRDRIRAGVAVVREVTASRIRGWGIDPNKRGHYVTREDIAMYGPLFVYNGIPEENEDFRRALDSKWAKIPKEKVIVLDKVVEDDGSTHPHRHTADQYRSFFGEVQNPKSPLYGVGNIALVAHIPDFVRHPFYTQLYIGLLEEATGNGIIPSPYGLRSRPGTEEEHLSTELGKLEPYAQKGDLAWEPAPMNL